MSVKLLDCTLRDGGYVNDWNFGKQNISTILTDLKKSGMEYIEIGFLRNESYSDNRTVFCSMKQVSDLIRDDNDKVKYSVMAESAHRIDVSKLEDSSASKINIVRIIIWKTKYDQNGKIVDALEEGYAYCKEFAEKGYLISIQPARAEQYSDEEFKEMLAMFSELSPQAFYIVDSWGTMYSRQILHYMGIADQILPMNTSVGYHGHNNQMQVFSTVEQIMNKKWDHEIIIDSSIYGIGRCAGNLNTEIVAKYINDNYNGKYDLLPLFHSYESCIKKIFQETPWGYSIPYLMTAIYHTNPNYGRYFTSCGINDLNRLDNILKNMNEADKILYSDELAMKYFDSQGC